MEPHIETADDVEVPDTEEMVDRVGELVRSIVETRAVGELAVLEAAVDEADNALDLISATLTVGPCCKV